MDRSFTSLVVISNGYALSVRILRLFRFGSWGPRGASLPWLLVCIVLLVEFILVFCGGSLRLRWNAHLGGEVHRENAQRTRLISICWGN